MQPVSSSSQNSNNFFSQGATLAWKLDPAFTSAILCVGDFDGDGLDEVLVSNTQEANPYDRLSVIYYLQYSELDSRLPDEADFVVMWNSATGIPQWTYPANPTVGSLAGFLYYVADVDQDGRDEIIAFFPNANSSSSKLGVLKWLNNELTCIWQTTSAIPASSGAGVTVGNSIQVYQYNDYNITSNCSLLLVQPGVSIAVPTWSSATYDLACFWSTTTSLTGNGNETSWQLSVNDQCAVADLDGDGRDEVILFQLGTQFAVAKWTSGSLEIMSYLSDATAIPQDCTSNMYGVYVSDLGNTGTVKITILTNTYNI